MDFAPRSNAWKRQGVVFFEELSVQDLLALGAADDQSELGSVNTQESSIRNYEPENKEDDDSMSEPKRLSSRKSYRESIRRLTSKIRRVRRSTSFGFR